MMSSASRSRGTPIPPLSAVAGHGRPQVHRLAQLDEVAGGRRAVEADVQAATPRPRATRHQRARAAVPVMGDADDPAQRVSPLVDDPAADVPPKLLRAHGARLPNKR